MDANKFKRLRQAAIQDENPLVAAFVSRGIPARRNKNVSTQIPHGDVLLDFSDGSQRSVESQVATYSNFSYSAHKVDSYKGPGLPQHAYVMLGAKRDSQSEDMFYVMCEATTLHIYLLANKDLMKEGNGKKYFVIPPGNLADLKGNIAAGDTIDEVVGEFLKGVLPRT